MAGEVDSTCGGGTIASEKLVDDWEYLQILRCIVRVHVRSISMVVFPPLNDSVAFPIIAFKK